MKIKIKNMDHIIDEDNIENQEQSNKAEEQPLRNNETENGTDPSIEEVNNDGDQIELKEEETIEVIEILTPGEISRNKKEEETEEIQEPHFKGTRPQIPVIDHRLLAGKLTVFDWLSDIPQTSCPSEIVEVRFKNTRKAFFSNPAKLNLQTGDIVAVEAALGHDIGVISLAGELVKDQIRLKRVDLERNPLKKVYRKAKPNDIEKWQQAIALEHETMIRSRKIAADLKLNMKIGDVEYQGDKTKAIFYYIAEDRVDFRTLIKVLAETFRIRIEMKQIGARQEAGRIGGIGPCGLKLCCSTFITNFISVSTSAARYQDISLNPQKLAGQCGKLKCCLNYEVDAYIDEQKDFPSINIPLNTGEGILYHQKTDIFGRVMSYSFDRDGKGIFIQIPVKRIKEIIALNRKGIIPPKAVEAIEGTPVDIKYTDGVGEESLNRFDEKRQKKHNHRNRNKNNGYNEENRNDRTEKTEKPEREENNKSIQNDQTNGNNNNRRGNNNRFNKKRTPRPDQKNEQKSEQPRQDPKQNTQNGVKPEQKKEQKPE